MKNKSWLDIVRYVVIEVFFTLFILGFLVYIYQTYSPNITNYDMHLFRIVFLGAILLIVFIGPMLNRFVLFVYTGLFASYLMSQSSYHNAFNSYYRFRTLIDLYHELVGVKDSAFEFVTREEVIVSAVFVVGTILFFVFYLLWQRKCFSIIYRIPYKLAILFLLLPMHSSYVHYLNDINATKNTEDAFQFNRTPYYIYEVIPNANQFVEEFGLLPFAYRDGELLLNQDVMSNEKRNEIASFLKELPEHNANEFTGLFEGKNVIFIQAESYNRASLDEELTPTLYKMFQEGIRIQNFNTPALPGSTSDTEFMANVSLIPYTDGHAVCYAYPTNVFPTTLPKLFRDAGYYTTAYHNNYGEYYNRNLVFDNYGYNDFIDCNDLGVPDESSDTVVEEIMRWIILEEEDPFMVYWITYSGHQPYVLDSVGVAEEDVALIKEKYPELDDSFVSYIAKNMDLDHCLADLLLNLEENGKSDDVVFVVFGDHEAKGIDFWGSSDFYKQTGIEPEDYYRYTDLYIYSTCIEEPVVYEKVATALDMLPTIANLWNLPYDSHTVLGRDIFDESYDGFFFSEWEYWRTNHYQYNFMNDEYILLDDYDAGKAEEEMRYYEKMKQISKSILQLDFFNENHAN